MTNKPLLWDSCALKLDRQKALTVLVVLFCTTPALAYVFYQNFTDYLIVFFLAMQMVHSTHGLLTTVAYQLGPNQPPVYALEGSVAIAGY